MLPSIADVLALPVVRRGGPRVVAGERGLSRRVRWAHAAEISDVARLLREGDLVLTTGIALPGDDAGLSAYVDDLAAARASGLAIELGRRWREEAPAAMVEACETTGLPLVTFGREVRFAAVTEAVGALAVDTQLAELRAADLVHRTFMALSVAGAGAAEILAEVRRMCGFPVVLESSRHQVLSYDLGNEDPADLLADWEERSRAVTPDERTTYDEQAGWLVTVVGARGDDWGRLIILCPESPQERHLVLAERGASTLALQRLAARDRESLERQTHRTLLTALTAGGPVDQDVITRSAAMGVPLTNRRLLAVVVRPQADPAAAAPVHAVEETLRDLAEITAGAARIAGVAALVGALDDESVSALISLRPGATDTAVADRLARGIHRAAKAAPRPVPVLIGAGTTVETTIAAGRTLTEAAHVTAAARRAPRQRPCHRLEDVRLRGMLHLLGDDDRLAGFVERELGPLDDYDRAHGTTLMESLRVYVTNGANKAAAAAAIHLSRAAFYERLARVERILNVDLSDPESAMSLHVAMLARDVVGGSGRAG